MFGVYEVNKKEKPICNLLFVPDSNLQTFPPSGSQGKISGGSRPPRDADGMLCYAFFIRVVFCIISHVSLDIE